MVIAVFALSDNDPVLELFTWLTNLGALGVFLLLALASFAVVGYFSRNPHEETPGRVAGAPALAGIALLGIFILALSNFNVLITGLQDAPTDDRRSSCPRS